MIDRNTKILLGLIAAGLWANVAALIFKTVPAYADSDTYLSSIDTHIGRLARGSNSKLC
jgi:hypothetical protein